MVLTLAGLFILAAAGLTIYAMVKGNHPALAVAVLLLIVVVAIALYGASSRLGVLL